MTTESFASDPEFAKKTRFRVAGVISASFAANSTAGGLVVWKKVFVVGQIEKLAIGRLREFLPPVTDIDRPQARQPVEQLVAVGIPEIGALCSRDDPDAPGREFGLVGEGVNVMLPIERLPVCRRLVLQPGARHRLPPDPSACDVPPGPGRSPDPTVPVSRDRSASTDERPRRYRVTGPRDARRVHLPEPARNGGSCADRVEC